jgi:hypothetical protein
MESSGLFKNVIVNVNDDLKAPAYGSTVFNRYPLPLTVSTSLPARPSFSRNLRTCVSTVRVSRFAW